MKVPLLAISAMIVFTACNREANRESKAADEAAQIAPDTSSLSEKARQEGREMEKDVSGAAKKTGDKASEEARQAGRDVKEGAQKTGSKVSEEARQTTRDVKRAFAGDKAVTSKDKEILSGIRASLKKDAETAKEAGDVDVAVDNGAVSLMGTVTSADVKTEMIRIVEKEKGVVKVTEQIKVAERVGAGSGD